MMPRVNKMSARMKRVTSLLAPEAGSVRTMPSVAARGADPVGIAVTAVGDIEEIAVVVGADVVDVGAEVGATVGAIVGAIVGATVGTGVGAMVAAGATYALEVIVIASSSPPIFLKRPTATQVSTAAHDTPLKLAF